jgi:hypothetical protein
MDLRDIANLTANGQQLVDPIAPESAGNNV